jgi:hypothetical protein
MKTRWGAVRLVPAALLLAAATTLWAGDEEADVEPCRWQADRLIEGGEAVRGRALDEHGAEASEIVRALIRVGSDADQGDGVRSRALLGLSRVVSAEGMAFCARHVSLLTDRLTVRTDESQRAYAPCRAVLIESGWAAVPACVERLLHPDTSEEDLMLLSFVLGAVCGRDVAGHLITSRVAASGSQSDGVRARLDRLTTYIREFRPPLIVPRPPR